MSKRGAARLSVAARWVIGPAALVCVACTALSDFSVQQCERDADCEVFDGGIGFCQSARCVAGCRDNQHCASWDPREPICTVREGDCVSLTTLGGECYASSGYGEVAMGEQTAVEMNVIGAFAPRLTSSEWLTMELAIEELGSSFPALQLRPPVLVVCDDDSATVTSGMAHLVEALQSRTVLASLDDRSLSLATAVAAESAGAVLLSPYGYVTRPAASGSEPAPLWYLGTSYEGAIDIYRAVLDRILDVLAATGKSRDRAHVAVVVAQTPEDSRQAAGLRRALDIDGKDADLLEREGRYLEVMVPDADGVARDEQLARLAPFAPDVVLSFMGSTFAEGARADRIESLVALDARLAEAAVRPYYVLGPRNGNEPQLTAAMRADPSLRSRSLLVDTGPERGTPLAEALGERFGRAFPATAVTDGYSPVPSIYDGVYLLALTLAVVETALSGVSVERAQAAFERLTTPTSTRIDLTPGLDSVALALQSGIGFNVRGPSGDWVFTDDHERAGVPSVYCWNEAVRLELVAHHDLAAGGLVSVESQCSGGELLGRP